MDFKNKVELIEAEIKADYVNNGWLGKMPFNIYFRLRLESLKK